MDEQNIRNTLQYDNITTPQRPLIYKILFKKDIWHLSNSPTNLHGNYFVRAESWNLSKLSSQISWADEVCKRMFIWTLSTHYRVYCPFVDVSQKLLWKTWTCFFARRSSLPDLTSVWSSFQCGFRVETLNEWADMHKEYWPRCVTAASIASAVSQQGLLANPLPSLNWISALISPGQSSAEGRSCL